ncbi:5'/3'-nucleotidase SurE [uncultured Cellulomonas sp.]|uniref:5'/3'-nucleotidase SurE n=1 Tax=uncultured Cellulomonas sp. TaxID=189682 RepID=UPI002622882E|nr:5'/3'-nucleotidase SurE [uncultured Cellulomonas sp.]
MITNDDGIDSPGLAVLARVALDAGLEVTVVAPATEHSGAGAALFGVGRDGQLDVQELPSPGLPDGVRSLAVGATPALLTLLAADGGFGPRPDVVLSGVNRGANTGNAVLHSGTVGAALCAASLGVRALAVSLDSADPQHWATAGVVTAHALPWALDRPAGDGVLNVNVPDLPVDRVRGVRSAPLARFGAVQTTVDADDAGRHTVRFVEPDRGRDPDSDAGLLAGGWATLTLLRAPCSEVSAQLPEHPRPLTAAGRPG